MDKKNNKQINLHIGSLIQNLVIVNTDKKETSETIETKVTEALLKALSTAERHQD